MYFIARKIRGILISWFKSKSRNFKIVFFYILAENALLSNKVEEGIKGSSNSKQKCKM